ncbi:hypothetical protein LTR85_007166 [Meristemomyces frigidus]|nr:hypothetical protein LTR85_007166 [Meristemomyces frigidus]
MAPLAVMTPLQPVVAVLDRSMGYWTLVLGSMSLLCAYSHWVSRTLNRKFSLLACEEFGTFIIPAVACLMVGGESDHSDDTDWQPITLLLFGLVFTFIVKAAGYFYLRRFVAGLRGRVDYLLPSEVEARLEQSPVLAKARATLGSIGGMCRFGVSERPGGPLYVRQYCAVFLAWERQLNGNGSEKIMTTFIHQDHIDLIFLAGLSYYLPEWTIVLSEQYSIGGVGTGPCLTVQQLMDMAVSEEDLPELERMVLPETLPGRWRKACYLFAGILLPTVVWAGVVDLVFVSAIV